MAAGVELYKGMLFIACERLTNYEPKLDIEKAISRKKVLSF